MLGLATPPWTAASPPLSFCERYYSCECQSRPKQRALLKAEPPAPAGVQDIAVMHEKTAFQSPVCVRALT